MRRLTLILGLALVGLSACEEASAPLDKGVCWRRGADGKLTVMARRVESLENCSVLLEGLRIMGESNTNGAFQGFFITVDAERMSSSPKASAWGYPIFQPPQRATIDKDLRRLIKERGGQLPSPGDLEVQRR